MFHLTPSYARVPKNTSEHINKRISDEAGKQVNRCAAGGREAIDLRLKELDEEWDIERTIGTLAPTAILVGLTLGLTKNKKFFAMPVAVASFLILHGLQGWAPPLPILRRLGFRTSEEIDEERYALRLLRGDFKKLPMEPGQVLSLVRKR